MPTHYPGTPEEKRALNALIKLMRATDSLGARLSRRQIFGDLTPTQFGVLETLYHLGPLCTGEIGAKLLKSGGNMTLVLDNLEQRGLVQRERDPQDRRRVLVSPTETGRALVEQLLPGLVATVVEEFSALTAEEQEQLGRLCRKLGTGKKEV